MTAFRASRPQALKLWELLADGGWHDAHEIVDLIGRTVAPGVAKRAAQHGFNSASARKNGGRPQPRTRPISDERLITIGQRAIAVETISNSRRTGRVELDPAAPGRRAWQHRDPIRIRWIGQPLGVVVEPADVTELRATLAHIRNRHHDDGTGLCAECGHPWECWTCAAASVTTRPLTS